ncbi:uncharacterized protein TNCV_2750361 [Trichonephila clavipes]|nr:uncharacterized protein TNCV_2750361 [Trichonephila clavipes]
MEGLPYCNLYRSKFGDQKWVLLGLNRGGYSQLNITEELIKLVRLKGAHFKFHFVVGHRVESMAALVSEYMLEFFTLLNARSKKELIEWCMKEGLIASSYECPKCNEQMGLNERKSVVLDGFEWRCRKKV